MSALSKIKQMTLRTKGSVIKQSLLRRVRREISHRALSDTANGRLPNKEKLALETYVQAAFFDLHLKIAL